MKPSQLRDWMHRYGNWGVLAAGGYLLLRHLRFRKRFALPLFVLCILLLLGIVSLRFMHRLRTAPKSPLAAPQPIIAAPIRPHPTWEPHSETVRRQLEKVEREISRYTPTPPKHAGEDEDKEAWVKETLESSLQIDPSGRAYADLGEFAYRSYDYAGAVKQYKQAVDIAPDVAAAQQGLSRSRNTLTIQTRVEIQAKRLLPTTQQVQTLFSFSVPGRTLWAALSCEAHKEHNDNTGATWFDRDNARITVFESEPKGWKVKPLWQSDLIPSIEHRTFVELNLWAFPMTGHKIPELVFMGVCSGGSANPSLLHVYRWNGKSFRNVLEAYSGECAQWITDLRHTGSYQVRSIDLVGTDLGHSGMIRWKQIYAWNGVRFAEANARYPEAFHESRDDLLDRLKAHPLDGDLWEYLGLTYLYDHKRHKALSAFTKAEQAFHNDPDYGLSGLAELAEIRGNRAAAARYYRQMAQQDRSLAAKEKDTELQHAYLEEARWAMKSARHPHN